MFASVCKEKIVIRAIVLFKRDYYHQIPNRYYWQDRFLQWNDWKENIVIDHNTGTDVQLYFQMRSILSLGLKGIGNRIYEVYATNVY